MDQHVGERISALLKSINTIRLDGGPSVQEVVTTELAGLFAGRATAYRPQLDEQGWDVEFIQSGGLDVHDPLHDRFRTFLRGAPMQWAAYTPLHPEPDQRNQVFGVEAMNAIRQARPPAMREVYEPLGIDRLSHMRVLVCDGPFLLTWLGAWRAEPFRKSDERLFGTLVEPLQRRLRAERMLASATSPASMASAIDAIAPPAFLVHPRSGVQHTNPAGIKMLASSHRTLVASLRSAVRAPVPPKDVTVVPCESSAGFESALVLMNRDDSLQVRVSAQGARWNLTRRQQQVLALIARGDSNKDIADKLRCAPRTVEVHVGAILRKARAESRALLMARFWTES